jgi:small subunit ribosomal protein S17
VSEHKVKKARPLTVRVTSDKMQKSRVATVERLVKHERYGRFIRKTTKLMFHDENNTSKAGDLVLVAPSRPYSSKKKFTLVQIVQKAKE